MSQSIAASDHAGCAVVEPAGASAAHRPAISAHRLLSDGRSTALIRPDGEVDWWCGPNMDSTPLLWSLLDATLVRMVVVPATMELLGDRNWWLPRWLDGLLPHVETERSERPFQTPAHTYGSVLVAGACDRGASGR